MLELREAFDEICRMLRYYLPLYQNYLIYLILYQNCTSYVDLKLALSIQALLRLYSDSIKALFRLEVRGLEVRPLATACVFMC